MFDFYILIFYIIISIFIIFSCYFWKHKKFSLKFHIPLTLFFAVIIYLCDNTYEIGENLEKIIDPDWKNLFIWLVNDIDTAHFLENLFFVIMILIIFFLVHFFPQIHFILIFKHHYFTKWGFHLLPEQKLKAITYSGDISIPKSKKEILRIFEKIYIEKRVYLCEYNLTAMNPDQSLIKPSMVIHNFKEEIFKLNEKNLFVIAGDAGSGKSTFMMKSYCELLKNNRIIMKKTDNKKSYQLLSIFYDLKEFKGGSLIDEIRKSLISSCIALNDFDRTRYIYGRLKEYKLVVFLDSIDECNISNRELDKNIFELIQNYPEAKFVLGIRKNKMIQFHNEFEKVILKKPNFYNVKEYSRTEAFFCVEKLFNAYNSEIINLIHNQNVEDFKNRIKETIDLVFIDDSANPFIVSIIIKSFLDGKSVVNNEHLNKIINIIDKYVHGLTDKINAGRLEVGTTENIENAFKIQGFLKKFTIKESNEDISNCLQMMGKSNNDYLYKDILNKVCNKTYLLDEGKHFYQEIFSDYYAAQFIMAVGKNYCYSLEKNPQKMNFRNLINRLFTNPNDFEKVIEFLLLLTDRTSEASYDETFLILFKDFIKTSEFVMNQEVSKEELAFRNTSLMLNIIKKYCQDRILNDELPREQKTLYNVKKLVKKIYKLYFNFLCQFDWKIDYNYFYYIVTIIDMHDIAIDTVLELEDVNKNYHFKMLSIIRDSYEALNYGNYINKSILNFSGFDKNKAYLLATNNKQLKDMNHRELLNALFYSEGQHAEMIASIVSPKILDKRNMIFPHFFDLKKYLGKTSSSNSIKLVRKESGIEYDSEENSNLLTLSVDEFFENNTAFILSSEVLSLCLYSKAENYKTLKDFIVNRSNVRSIDIFDSFQVIDKDCFSKMHNLVNLVLPSSLEELADFSLYDCPRLKRLTIPTKTKKIGESFIEDCSSITELKLPCNLSYLGDYAFEGMSSLKKVDFQNINIPLGQGLFKNCLSMKSIQDFNFNISLNSFPSHLFFKCKNLEKLDLTLFENLYFIDDFAFAECKSLKEIYLPKSLKKLGMLTFYKCDKLNKVVFNGQPQCSDNVFAELDHKITIVINNREEDIYTNDDFNKLVSKINGFSKRDFFVNDIALRKNIDDNKYSLVYSFNSENPKFTEFSLDTYGNYIDNKTGELYQIDKTIIGAMGNQAYLDRVVLQSEDAFALSSWLFEDCESLYQVDFSKLNVKDGILPEAIFINCKSLSNVYLTNIKRIEASAFNNCISLTEVRFSNERSKETEYGELRIPFQIEHIGKNAFKNCNKIKRIIFSSKDINIEEYAFSEMHSLQEVEFPSDFNFGGLPDAIFNNGTEITIKGNVKIDEDEKIRIGITPKKRLESIGEYPSKLVTDKDLISKLKMLLTKECYVKQSLNYKPDDRENWFCDIEYQNKKYRALYFENYKSLEYNIPEGIDNYLCQNVNKFVKMNVYFFEYEPMVWNIIKEDETAKILITKQVVDSRHFNDSLADENQAYPNEYNHSSLKVWIEKSLKNTLFSVCKKLKILEMRLANFDEFESIQKLNFHQAKPTDYAKAQGVYCTGKYAAWWIDKKGETNNLIHYITAEGIISPPGQPDSIVTRTDGGIRILLKIQK